MAQNLLATPPAATSTSNASASSSATTKQSPNQQRLAVLRQKRQDLEKRLQEKNNLLQELVRKEAHLIGVYPTVTVAGQEGHHHHHPSSSADDISGSSKGHYGHNTHSLPRKIGTGFTLSEKYLNKRTLSSPLNPATQSSKGNDADGGVASGEDALNNLLLQRDIQQQICYASLKLLNDSALTKSVRRKHKQSYEVAQLKLLEIGQGLSSIQQQQSKMSSEAQQVLGNPSSSSQTLALTVKTNFKVPHYPGESPVAQHQRRPRHDSYHHSPVSTTGYAMAATGGDHPGSSSGQHPIKGLYRSSSNSSSLNNANVLGKSSLSLDNAHHQHQHQQQQQSAYGQPHQSQHQPQQLHSKPMPSYESKSLHNFIMSSPNHSSSSATAYHTSPHHHPALLSPTFYHHPNAFASGANNNRTANHYPGNSAGLRNSHQQQQQQQSHQFMSPPPQQVVIPQSGGLGGYWTLNENNERVWCASSIYSPEQQSANQRHATTLDRKAAIYVPNTSHGKMKMPSPETSPSHRGQGFGGDTSSSGGGFNQGAIPGHKPSSSFSIVSCGSSVLGLVR